MTREEFNHISAAFRGKLEALAGRFGESALLPFSAEDIVQEALTALWQLSERNYPIRDYEAMAVTITKNKVQYYRRQFPHSFVVSVLLWRGWDFARSVSLRCAFPSPCHGLYFAT